VRGTVAMDRSRVERAMRWALIELGTAGLSDQLGPGCVVALPPQVTRTGRAVVAGPVRDVSRLDGTGIPVLACRTSPQRPVGAAMELMPELRLFNRTWVPGDWALMDADGLLQLHGDAADRLASQLAAGAADELASLLADG
jgi:hypothetical protein